MFGKNKLDKDIAKKTEELNERAEAEIRKIIGNPVELEKAKATADDPLVQAIGEHVREVQKLFNAARGTAISDNSIGLVMAINAAKLAEAVEKATGYKIGGKSGRRSTSKPTRKSTSRTSD